MIANLEQPHSPNAVAHIECEAVVDASGKDQEVTGTHVATNPTFSGVFLVGRMSGSFRTEVTTYHERQRSRSLQVDIGFPHLRACA